MAQFDVQRSDRFRAKHSTRSSKHSRRIIVDFLCSNDENPRFFLRRLSIAQQFRVVDRRVFDGSLIFRRWRCVLNDLDASSRGEEIQSGTIDEHERARSCCVKPKRAAARRSATLSDCAEFNPRSFLLFSVQEVTSEIAYRRGAWSQFTRYFDLSPLSFFQYGTLGISLLRWNLLPRTSTTFCSKIVMFPQFQVYLSKTK